MVLSLIWTWYASSGMRKTEPDEPIQLFDSIFLDFIREAAGIPVCYSAPTLPSICFASAVVSILHCVRDIPFNVFSQALFTVIELSS